MSMKNNIGGQGDKSNVIKWTKAVKAEKAEQVEPVLTLDAWNAAVAAYHKSIEFANLDNPMADQEMTLLAQHVFSPVWTDENKIYKQKLPRTLNQLRESIDNCVAENTTWNIDGMVLAIQAAFEKAYSAAETEMNKGRIR